MASHFAGHKVKCVNTSRGYARPTAGLAKNIKGEISVERKGLLIEYDYCTGCYSCEVACKQEHNFSTGTCGIKLNEIITEKEGRMRIDYFPFITQHCNLCASLTAHGEQPACVKHCQSAIMWYGTIKELAGLQENKPRSVIFAPL